MADKDIDSAGRECLTAERGVMLREYRGSMERGRWLTKTLIQQEGAARGVMVSTSAFLACHQC